MGAVGAADPPFGAQAEPTSGEQIQSALLFECSLFGEKKELLKV